MCDYFSTERYFEPGSMMSGSFHYSEGYARHDSEMSGLLKQLSQLVYQASIVGFMMHPSAWSDAPVPGTKSTAREISEKFLAYAADSGKVICLVIYTESDRAHFPPIISTLETVYTISMPFATPVRQDLDIVGVLAGKILQYEHMGEHTEHLSEVAPEAVVLVTLGYMKDTR